MLLNSFMPRAAAGLALALVPMAACADPVTILTVAAYFVGGAKVAMAVMVIGSVIGAVNARRQARKAAQRARNSYNAQLQDRTTTMLQSTPGWRIVYGRARVGGDIVAQFHSGHTTLNDRGKWVTKADGLMHLVIVVAAHQVHEIHEVYINGEPIGPVNVNRWATAGPADAPWGKKRDVVISPAEGIQFDAAGQYTVPEIDGMETTLVGVGSEWTYTRFADHTTDGQRPAGFSGRTINGGATFASRKLWGSYTLQVTDSSVRWQAHLGAPGEPADSYLMSKVPEKWTASHVLPGFAYVVLTIALEDSRFQGGLPPVDFDVSGRLLHDPRTGQTAFSANPALAVRDWLMSPWGYGVPESAINTQLTIAAANACDEQLVYRRSRANLIVNATCARYSVNGGYSTDTLDREQALESLVDAMAGELTNSGQWCMFAGVWHDPVMHLTDNDIVGPIEIEQAGNGYESAFNGLRAVYIPAGAATQRDLSPAYQSAVFRQADGEDLWADVELPWTDHPFVVRNICRIQTEVNRLGLVARIPASDRAWPLQPGDRISITCATFQWQAKTFRVTDWDFSLAAPIGLIVQEDVASAWDLEDAVVVDDAPNTGAANPWAVTKPGEITVTSGTETLLRLSDGTVIPRVRVEWPAPAMPYTTGPGARTEVRWARKGEDGDSWAWRTDAVPGDVLSTYLVGMDEFAPIVIGVRHINSLGHDGPWGYADHTPIGESAPPGNVSNFAAGSTVGGQVPLTWDRCEDLDYRETVISLGASFSEAVPQFTGSADGASWTPPGDGTHTLWAVHRDRAGNASLEPAAITVTVTAAELAAADAYITTIESTAGTEFRVGGARVTLMKAHVFRNGLEVTDEIPASWFRWRRVSVYPEDQALDPAWNAAYASGYRQIQVDVDEVDACATFHCDIVRPD